MTVADAKQKELPLIYVNQGFTKTTGYSFEESEGRNCNFLQGKDTSKKIVNNIRDKLNDKESFTTEILNYRKDGTKFWNELNIFPIFSSNELQYYVGVQKDITAKVVAEKEIEDNMKLAKKLQSGVLPKSISNQWIHIDGIYEACDYLGGDLYYWCQIDDDQYGVMMIDVMGHGVSSSLVGISIRSLLTDLMTTMNNPEVIMRTLNKHMYHLFGDIDEVMYFTGICMYINLKTKSLKYINAGHPPGVIFSENGTFQTLNSKNIPVGISADHPFESETLYFDSNSRILLYTDGLLDEKLSLNENVESVATTIQPFLHSENKRLLKTLTERACFKSNNDDIAIISIHLK